MSASGGHTAFEACLSVVECLRASPAAICIVAVAALDNPAVGALSGLVRVLRIEHPEFTPRLIHIEGEFPHIDIRSVVTELLSSDKEDWVRIIGSERQVARFRQLEVDPVQSQVAFDSDASLLITGGTRGLGLLTAKWAVERGARRVILVGRSVPPDCEALQHLEKEGAAVEVLLGDISDPRFVAKVFDVADPFNFPLRYVVHAAGVLADAPLLEFDRSAAAVFNAKVTGALNLHHEALKRGVKLHRFVLYSSVVGTIGNPGQASHALQIPRSIPLLAGEQHIRFLHSP